MENEQTWMLLSAYIDGELNQEEQQTLEARLKVDAALRAELAELRHLAQLVKAMPQVAAPRSFALDPVAFPTPQPQPRSGGVVRFPQPWVLRAVAL
ncbi:MAG: hypothetical protein HC915_11760 [Anaerolineae bacterium]|nr:hypothetical protein [Anaerolineae bacterium]